MTLPKASIVILTRDAGPDFRVLLDRLVSQRTDFSYEVVVIDSGSTDGTAATARDAGVRVHAISSSEFSHGATRNLGASLCRGEYVAFLVQDALPLNERWLSALVEALENDERVAGVYSRQLPRPESGPLTRILVGGWATAAPKRRFQFAGNSDSYRALPPEEKLRVSAFDNVSSCVQRSILEQHPFEQTGFGEDLRWGASVVEAGYAVVYEPDSTVLHSHERGVFYDLRRHYANGKLLLDLFGVSLTPNILRLVLNTLLSTGYLGRRLFREEKTLRRRIRFTLLAAAHASVGQLGAYLAAKNILLASRNPRLSRAVDAFLEKGV